MSGILITGGTIVNRGRSFRGYLIIKDGRIVRVGEGDYPGETVGRDAGKENGTASACVVRRTDAKPRAVELALTAEARRRKAKPEDRSPCPIGVAGGAFDGERIDATGRIVMPGVIDAHVHLREPGLTHKGDIHSETVAAVAGGVTSVMDMPNTAPATTSLDELERKFELGAAHSVTNYSFYLGATRDNLVELRRIDPRTVCGVKLFMGSSTGGMLVDDQKTLAAIFAESPIIVAVHSEDEATIRADTERCRREWGERATAAIHPQVRSAEACYRSTACAIELADRYGAQLHVLHLTTARELTLLNNKQLKDKKITAEACVLHLWFSDEDYARLGNLIKVNPAVKSAADRAALRGALLTGRIDTVATDHAPHTLAEKMQPYWQAPSGAPMVQHSLLAMMELAHRDVLPVETVVEKMCHAPAVRYGVRGRGFLDEGMWADVVVVDPTRRPVVRREDVLYKCGWSPLEGAMLGCSVDYTIVNGRVVNRLGAVDGMARGVRLEFER